MTMMTMIPMPSLPPPVMGRLLPQCQRRRPPWRCLPVSAGPDRGSSALVSGRSSAQRGEAGGGSPGRPVPHQGLPGRHTDPHTLTHTHWHKTIQVQQIISTERESKIRLVPIVFVFLKFSLMVFVCYFCFLKLCFIFCYDSCFCGVV